MKPLEEASKIQYSDPSRARRILEDSIASADLESLLLLGRLESRQGDYKEALATFFCATLLDRNERLILPKFTSLFREIGEFGIAHALLNREIDTAESPADRARASFGMAMLLSHASYSQRNLSRATALVREASAALKHNGDWAWACFELEAYVCSENPDSTNGELKEVLRRLENPPRQVGYGDRTQRANRSHIRGVCLRRLGLLAQSATQLDNAITDFSALGLVAAAGLSCLDLAICGLEGRDGNLVRKAAGRAFKITKKFTQSGLPLSSQHEAIRILVRLQALVALDELSRIQALTLRSQMQAFSR